MPNAVWAVECDWENSGTFEATARQFTIASSEYFTRSDNASLSVADEHLWLAGWVYLDAKADAQGIVSKWGGAGAREYSFEYHASDRFRFQASPDGTAVGFVDAESLGSPTVAAWYCYFVWHDPDLNTLNVQINNGTVDSAAHTTGLFDGATQFNIGAKNGSVFLGGRCGPSGFWKPGAAPTAAERAAFYNNGEPLVYSQLAGLGITAPDSYWNMDEASGDAIDSIGINDLTDTNTVTTAAANYTTLSKQLTADVIEAEWSLGRDYASQLTGRSVAGALTLRLLNTSGTYNSFNTASSIFGNILPRRKVRVRTVTPSATTQWTGYLDRIDPMPMVGKLATARLTAYGPLGVIAGRETSLALQANVTTDVAFGAVLDDVGWPAADRSLDTGLTTMGRFWTDKLNALTALRKLEDTESGFIREGKDGKIYFHKRLYRLSSPYSVSQATYTDAAGGTIGYRGIVQQDPLKEIYNEIRTTVQQYSSADAPLTLWTLSESSANSPLISPGQDRTWWAQYPGPNSPASGFAVDLWTSPASNTDFTANASALGGGDDLTAYLTVTPTKFANAMKITVSSTGSQDAYLTLLQGRGVPVYARDPVQVVSESTASQTKYLKRTFNNPGEFIPNTEQAQSYCDFNLSIYKDPNPILTITVLANLSSAILAECLARDIGDRITVVANNTAGVGTNLGINTDFFIESIRHHVTREGVHTMEIQCSPASMFAGFFVLDSTSLLDGADRLAF